MLGIALSMLSCQSPLKKYNGDFYTGGPNNTYIHNKTNLPLRKDDPNYSKMITFTEEDATALITINGICKDGDDECSSSNK